MYSHTPYTSYVNVFTHIICQCIHMHHILMYSRPSYINLFTYIISQCIHIHHIHHMLTYSHTLYVNVFTYTFYIRPTQSVMYVPLQVNRFAESVLLIVQYRFLKSCSGDFNSPESDPPHKIMRYWVYYSTQLCFSFPPDRICQVEMICIGGVPVSKRHFGGAGP